MTRDMETVLQILEVLEGRRAGDLSPPRPDEIDGISKDELNEYLLLLNEAGYVHGNHLSSVTHGGGPPRAAVTWEDARLGWEGHEFLTAARNPQIREEAERSVGSPLVKLSFNVATAVLTEAAKRLVFGAP